MPDFPSLKTGAVAQDGLLSTMRFGTRVVKFADGTEQRFRERGNSKRRWAVQLNLLTDEELHLLTAFVESRQGRHGSFSFTDPWDQVEYLDCSLESDVFETILQEPARAGATIVIRQN